MNLRLLPALLLLLPSCAHELDPQAPPGDEDQLTQVEPDELSRDGAFAIAPPLRLETPATRVGLMIELTTAEAAAPLLEVRATRAGAPGAWTPVQITFEEAGLINAHVDFDEPFDGAELRLPAADADRLQLLAWTGIVPAEDEGEAEGPAPVSGGVVRQALDAELTALGVQSRAAWGARAPACVTQESQKHRMTVHHTVTFPDRPALRMRQMQSFHIDQRGWCDLAYHFVIALDGSVWEARPITTRGGHVSYQNRGNIGISYLGCFSDFGCGAIGQLEHTAASIDAGRRLIATLSARFDIPRVYETVRGHTDWPNVSKPCPGENTEAFWDELRSGFTDEELGLTGPEVEAGYGLFDPGSARWHLRGPGAPPAFDFGAAGDFPLMGDWDCDGDDTVAVLRPSTGTVYLRNQNSTGAGERAIAGAASGDVPVAGDFNGDGCDSIAFYRPTSGQAFVYLTLPGSFGAPDLSYFFGNPGDKPFAGDFDGDGVDTLGLHRETTGLVYFRQSHTQGVADAEFFFGNPDDRLVAADWNGDGVASPAVFRPGNTRFYFRYTNTQGNADAETEIGQGAWLPVAGRW